MSESSVPGYGTPSEEVSDYADQKRSFTNPFKIGKSTYEPGSPFVCKRSKYPDCYDLYLLDGTGIIKDVSASYIKNSTKLLEM